VSYVPIRAFRQFGDVLKEGRHYVAATLINPNNSCSISAQNRAVADRMWVCWCDFSLCVMMPMALGKKKEKVAVGPRVGDAGEM
jgi:hypothetical protein